MVAACDDFTPTNKVYYSTNAGTSWTAATGIPTTGTGGYGRVQLAVSASTSGVVYAGVDWNSSFVKYNSPQYTSKTSKLPRSSHRTDTTYPSVKYWNVE